MRQVLLPIIISLIFVILVFVLFENLEMYFTELLDSSSANMSWYACISFLILSSDIVLPVPSSIVMFMNGTVLGFTGGFLLSLISALLSASLGYYLGRFSNLGMKEQKKAHLFIQKYGGMAILLSRGVPILSESISITAGFNKTDFKTYFVLNMIGYLPVCFVYSFFGNLGRDTNLFLISFSLALIFSGFVWFFGKAYLKKGILKDV